MSNTKEDSYPFAWRFKTEETQILAGLAKHKVPFFIDGGVACCFHGIREVYECTNDMDIVLSPDPISATKCAAAFVEIEHAFNFSLGFTSIELALPKKQFRILAGQLDFRTIESEVKFQEHYKKATIFNLFDVELYIASVSSLIELKMLAIEADQEVAKHEADLLRLKAIS